MLSTVEYLLPNLCLRICSMWHSTLLTRRKEHQVNKCMTAIIIIITGEREIAARMSCGARKWGGTTLSVKYLVTASTAIKVGEVILKRTAKCKIGRYTRWTPLQIWLSQGRKRWASSGIFIAARFLKMSVVQMILTTCLLWKRWHRYSLKDGSECWDYANVYTPHEERHMAKMVFNGKLPFVAVRVRETESYSNILCMVFKFIFKAWCCHHACILIQSRKLLTCGVWVWCKWKLTRSCLPMKNPWTIQIWLLWDDHISSKIDRRNIPSLFAVWQWCSSILSELQSTWILNILICHSARAFRLYKMFNLTTHLLVP